MSCSPVKLHMCIQRGVVHICPAYQMVSFRTLNLQERVKVGRCIHFTEYRSLDQNVFLSNIEHVTSIYIFQFCFYSSSISQFEANICPPELWFSYSFLFLCGMPDQDHCRNSVRSTFIILFNTSFAHLLLLPSILISFLQTWLVSCQLNTTYCFHLFESTSAGILFINK